ncbi:MAG: glutamine amidotransferase-related protein, partial [Alphaproteobacteria bacterium]
MTKSILLIDNYDSFTYNLVHYLSELGAAVEVLRNDALSASDILGKKPSGIVLSPGPATPNQAGVCLELIARAA